ncbi:unknown protein [Seminavis robusta]|uniref:Uncharacterized protein n=1 Tax=Seminavis robusta TaxID=568900 RepID=A0A9N8DKY1_9STRA|nr:unknown protein [Seminavis robusta]|eukprot:Sro139_g065060.1 n/a (634) ;mRNA; f:43982-45883
MVDTLGNNNLSLWQARERLTLLFHFPHWTHLTKTSPNSEQDGMSVEALSILKHFPTLAAEPIEHHCILRDSERRYPLEFFVQAGFDLATVKQVYELYPGAIHGCQGSSPTATTLPLLHKVCIANTAREDVIQFLALEDPDAVRECCRPAALLQALLKPKFDRAPPSWSLIQSLLHEYPECGSTRNEASGFLLLEELFRVGYEPKELQTVVSMLSSKVDAFTVSTDLSSTRGQMTLERVKVVQQLLPNLRTISFQQLQWTFDGFHELLRSLSHHLSMSSSLQEIEEWVLPREILEGSLSARLLLKEVLVQNASITAISFSGPVWTYKDGDRLLLDISDSIAKCKVEKLQSLTLQRFQCTSETLDKIVSSPCAPRNITLSNLEVTEPASALSRRNVCWQQSSVERLTLDWLEASDSCLHKLLSNLARMPQLRELEISPLPNQSKLDITTPIVTLLQQGYLQVLRVERPYGARKKFASSVRRCNLWVDPAALCRELETNGSLKELVVASAFDRKSQTALGNLLKTNTRLEKVWIQGPVVDKHQKHIIEYYTSLNRNGRIVVRRNDASKLDLVRLLAEGRTQESARHEGDHQDEDGVLLELFNVYYGLLRESPNLWCLRQSALSNGPTTRKRLFAEI